MSVLLIHFHICLSVIKRRRLSVTFITTSVVTFITTYTHFNSVCFFLSRVGLFSGSIQSGPFSSILGGDCESAPFWARPAPVCAPRRFWRVSGGLARLWSFPCSWCANLLISIVRCLCGEVRVWQPASNHFSHCAWVIVTSKIPRRLIFYVDSVWAFHSRIQNDIFQEKPCQRPSFRLKMRFVTMESQEFCCWLFWFVCALFGLCW